MHSICRSRLLCNMALVALALLVACEQPLWGQDAGKKGFRKLAPGVETTIPPQLEEEETVSTHNVIELHSIPGLEWSPNYTPTSRTLIELSKDVKFRRQVTGLHFTFKPMRMMHVDIPQTNGKMQRKLIWYLVYRVTNYGGHLTPRQQEDGTFAVEKKGGEVHFHPHFVLESHRLKRAYLDRVVPVAIGPIQDREDANRKLLNSVQMSQKPIPVSTDRVDRSVWGVATWEDIDPRIDFFSVFVSGLTNAYRWKDPEGAYRPGDPAGKGRKFVRKTLQLNFWRPGDQYDEHEEEIRFGTPHGWEQRYGVPEGVDYVWIYR